VPTAVHEYGGGPLVVYAGTVYFLTTNSVYRQCAAAVAPDPLVDVDARLRFAEPVFAHDSLYLVCEGMPSAVCEGYCTHADHSDEAATYPSNRLVRIHPASASVEKGVYAYPNMTTVAEGADFYAAPKVSPSGTLMVWMQWNHPNMVSVSMLCMVIAAVGCHRDLGGRHRLVGRREWGTSTARR